jgi:hypothetical protein
MTVAATSPVKATPSGLVVLGPAGVRIEGLDVATLADLLRRLG